MNYLIRATSKRRWYVEKYLVPELESQGCGKINRNIIIFEDNSGNLSSFIHMCKYIVENYRWNDFIWVLQDDVYPCDNFHYITNKYCYQEMNGFCSGKNNIKHDGYLQAKESWLSFQCKNFRVDKLKVFLDWYYENIQYNELIKGYVNSGKNDDIIYHRFEVELNQWIYNMSPNLVEHVDYLLGGSIVNKDRLFDIKSQNFEDKLKIKHLEEKINEDKC